MSFGPSIVQVDGVELGNCLGSTGHAAIALGTEIDNGMGSLSLDRTPSGVEKHAAKSHLCYPCKWLLFLPKGRNLIYYSSQEMSDWGPGAKVITEGSTWISKICAGGAGVRWPNPLT